MPHDPGTQLKPGPKNIGRLSYRRKPPGIRIQKTFRACPDLIEKVEERALEESMRLGVTVKFADLARRGLELMLAEPLPGEPAVVKPCNVIRLFSKNVGCLECMKTGDTTGVYCAKQSKRVTIDD